jgi:hypothetical protein
MRIAFGGILRFIEHSFGLHTEMLNFANNRAIHILDRIYRP